MPQTRFPRFRRVPEVPPMERLRVTTTSSVVDDGKAEGRLGISVDVIATRSQNAMVAIISRRRSVGNRPPRAVAQPSIDSWGQGSTFNPMARTDRTCSPTNTNLQSEQIMHLAHHQLLFFGCISTIAATGSPIFDQVQPNHGDSIDGSSLLYQTFTPAVSGQLLSVGIALGGATEGSLWLSIYDSIDDFFPGTSLLGSGIATVGVPLPAGISPYFTISNGTPWVDIDTSALDILLEAETKYTIKIEVSDAFGRSTPQKPGTMGSLQYNDGGGYARGDMFLSLTTLGNPDNPGKGGDLVFYTRMETSASAIPEASTSAVAVLAPIALAGYVTAVHFRRCRKQDQ